MLQLLASVSLFEPRPTGVLDNALGWITGTLLGTLATTICVIAIAFVGFQMLAGRLPVRRGMMVVVGCFLLLGAPLVAASIGGLWQTRTAPLPPRPEPAADPRGDLPPAGDPYAGASLRQD